MEEKSQMAEYEEAEPPRSFSHLAQEDDGTTSVFSWKRTFARHKKQVLAGWKIYRKSRIGMAGMIIMLSFVFMAVFAPFLTPYDPDFIAPAEDVFNADYISIPIPEDAAGGMAAESWSVPMGSSGSTEALDTITVYSREGHAVQFSVDLIAAEGGGVGIDIPSSESYDIPVGIDVMLPVLFKNEMFFAIGNEALHELSYDTFTTPRATELGFEPTYYSNLWNRWSLTNTEGQLFFAMANETILSIYSRTPDTSMGMSTVKVFFDKVNISSYAETADDVIIADPIIINLADEENGSMVVVPTDGGVAAFELNISYSGGLFNTTDNVGLGDMIWYISYEDIGDQYSRDVEPALEQPIAISKENPSEKEGKNRIIFASRDGYLYSIFRSNGTLEWSTTIASTQIRSPETMGIYPTYRGVIIVTGMTEPGVGFITIVDPENGLIEGGGTWIFTPDSAVIGRPEYVASIPAYIFASQEGTIYILEETMELRATFSIPGGTETTTSYVGNIVNNIGSYQGNYFAVVTSDGKLYAQSITGTYVAPLPPGTYPSGNTYHLGTDVFGHDILTNLLYATRTELVIGIVAAVLSAVLGTIVGIMAGYYGGWIDSVLMRLTDIFLTLPMLVVALLFAAVLGPSILNIIIIIAIFSWAGVARVIRAQTLTLKTRCFIDAAKVSGASDTTIIFRHLAPNVLPLTFLYMVFIVSAAIITEAILAFLGMGDQTAVTWGMMLQYLKISGNTLTAPWWLLPPGIAITMFSLSFYMMGRAFDEVINPRLRSR